MHGYKKELIQPTKVDKPYVRGNADSSTGSTIDVGKSPAAD